MERDLLTTCGLNETEQTVLLYLLEYGRTGAAMIAKRTGIKRPTVYSCIASLESMGLIGKHVVKNTTHFSAVDPDTIPNVFINRAKSNFEKVTQAAFQLETEFQQYNTQQRKRIGGYEISTLDSGDAMWAFLERTLTRGNYRGIFNPQTSFIGRGKEVGELCLKVTAKSKSHIREIAVDGPLCDWWVSNIKNPNHKVLRSDMNNNLLTDVLLSDDTVILTNYDPDREMAILIKHPHYYELMVGIFDAFWNALRGAEGE